MALGPSRTIHSGQPAVLGAYAARSRSGARVVLQRYLGKGWRPLHTRRADQSGRAFFRVAPGRTSFFRIVASGTTSGVARINVARFLMRRGNAIVAEASRYRGAPYRFGAAGPRAFDCSGFTQYVYRKFGHSLPHSATAQSRLGVRVAKAAAQPGDLVLFGRGGRFYHAAIYAGRGYMWDASTYGRPVALRRIYSQAFIVRRVI
jgi:cell wall-associated NlpC family hydrolase